MRILRFTLLIGNEAVLRKDAAMQREVEAEGYLPEAPEGNSINDGYDSIVVDLGQFLKQDKEQLRQNPERFSHAKCCIFDCLAVVGSGNFTRPGLSESPSRPNGSEKAFILVSA